MGCLIWRMIASAGILDSGTFFGKKWHAIFRARRVLAKMSRTLAVMNDIVHYSERAFFFEQKK